MMEKYPTLEDVDGNLLQRFNDLVQQADSDAMAKLLESWAKYVAARRNNDSFGKTESQEERQQREVASVLEAEING